MPSFYRLLFLEAIPAERLNQVLVPHLAHKSILRLRYDLDEIDGGEDALRWICDRNGIQWDWKNWELKQRERLVEKLYELAEHGIFAVIHKFRGAIVPAFQKADGEWRPTRSARSHSPLAYRRFTHHLEHRKHEEQERKAWQERNQPSTPEVLEPAVGPVSRKPTLGPHEGRDSVAPSTINNATAPFATGLGQDVDQLAAKSPSLQRDLQALDKAKWRYEYGAAGKGSYASRGRNPRIVIDGALKSHPQAATQTLAHEVGHATYNYNPDYSSKAAYVNGALADEGAATLNNIKVQREILANGGPDIGIAGNRANHAAYNRTYDQLLKDGNAQAARESIGKQFGQGEITSNTGQPYAEYYGGWYDKAYPPQR